jgi:hypothetical protein
MERRDAPSEREHLRARRDRLREIRDDCDFEVEGRSASTENEPARSGPTPLTTCQSWFLHAGHFDDLNRWNVATVMGLQRPLVPDLLRRVIRILLDRHDALRARFRRDDEGAFHQTLLEPRDVDEARVFSFVHRPEVEAPPARDEIVLEVARELQDDLRLEEGVLVRFVLFEFGAERAQRLLFVAHHIVLDALSYQVLFEDLEAAYLQLSRGRAPDLKALGTPFRKWALAFADYARSSSADQVRYLLDPSLSDIVSLPLDQGVQADAALRNTEATAASAYRAWNRDSMRRLTQSGLRYGLSTPQILLLLLVELLFEWSEAPALPLKLMNAGRFLLPESAGLDAPGGVGPYAFGGLAVLRRLRGATRAERVADFRRQLAAIPGGGCSAEIVAQFSEVPELRAKMSALLARNQVLFNYFFISGTAESSELIADFAALRDFTRTSSDRRPDVLECIFAESSAGLRLELGFCRALHDPATIEGLLDRFAEHVTAWIVTPA